jgi:hypothetical protein
VPPQLRALLDWCTYPPVGHAVEGLRVAHSFHAADPELAVSIVLNADTPLELATCCPWIDGVYGVRFDDVDGVEPGGYAGVPRDWDWVVQEHRRRSAERVSALPAFGRLAAAADAHYRPRRAGAPPARKGERLRLEPPAAARAEAAALSDGRPSIAVMLSGSGPRERYPSAGSWRRVLEQLSGAFPSRRLVLIGRTTVDRRTRSCIGREEAAQATQRLDVLDAYDLPLLTQLALAEASELFVSPHTGFGFAVLGVGTPWLTISGGPWFEYFHNGVPFHSLLPDGDRFPAFSGRGASQLVDDDDGSGPREPAMTRRRIVEMLPELVEAASSLATGARTYDECLAHYFRSLRKALGGDSGRITSWDSEHRPYV